MSDIERSAGGSPIYRHKARETDFTPPEHATEFLEEISAHVEQHVGEIKTVFHELISDLVHLDVHWVEPTAERPYQTLITSGCSDLPMTVPPGAEEFKRAELLITLPPTWPISEADFRNENNYWPIYWLKTLARLPHEYNTWIGHGHTIPNGDPAKPIANTRFTGFVILPPFWLPNEFFRLETKSGEPIFFYSLFPLYQEEMDFKLNNGVDALLELFSEKDVPFVVDTKRPNTLKKWWKFW